MCTVTFFPTKNGYFLTSNRDEKFTRKKALEPSVHIVDGIKLIFPTDGDVYGTWILLKENGESLCLLNGAFENFTETNSYTNSRGKIILKIAKDTDMVNSFEQINLLQTAPFTLIIKQQNKLVECKWDGLKKYCSILNTNMPYIWSSCTLYNATQQQLRSKWFKDWLQVNPAAQRDDIIFFHKNGGDGNREHDLMMNREEQLFTVSITCVAVNVDTYLMQYTDTINHDSSTIAFNKKD